MIRRRVSETIGWYGVLAILGAYATSNLGLLDISSPSYKLLNLTGAVALIIDCWPDRNWQTIVINGVWAVVAIVAVL